MSWLQKIYWNHFGKPVSERALFAALLAGPFDSVLEVGVGNGDRLRRIAKLLQSSSGDSVRYIGTDPFESSSDDRPHLTLKAAHRLASQLGLRASLLPGDAPGALPRVAHKFGPSELVIIDGGIDPADPLSGPVGSWLLRVTDETSVVLVCQEAGETLVPLDMAALSSEQQSLPAAA
ncbi:MAG TPA: hypothetical protein DDW52_28965 [Planctomycetaceae bacterium]|nr:hypothetical protein [Planctomycetaceae bacterium]